MKADRGDGRVETDLLRSGESIESSSPRGDRMASSLMRGTNDGGGLYLRGVRRGGGETVLVATGRNGWVVVVGGRRGLSEGLAEAQCSVSE